MFNKFNNTGARILDSIYHMTLKLLNNHILSENVKILLSFLQLYNGHHYVTKSINHWWFIDSLASVISPPDATSCDNIINSFQTG